eukprot:1162101-Pelagomonas_calceolata.AAC.6
MFQTELLLLNSAGLAAANKKCRGPDQLSPGWRYIRDRYPWHKVMDNRNRAKPQWKMEQKAKQKRASKN